MSIHGEPYVDARYPRSAETARILAAAKEVHRHLGPGFEIMRHFGRSLMER
jgi:hypothetical protein